MIVTLGTSPTVQRTMRVGELRPGGVCRATAVRDFASGKAVNVARVLTQLGADVLALGIIGGARGEFLRRNLDEAGVRHHFLAVQARTRFCVTVVDEQAGRATELIEEPAEVEAVTSALLIVALREYLDRADLLVLSGSLAPGISDDFYARCAAEAHERGVPVVVDARGPALMKACGEGPLVAKPNADELAATLGRPLGTRSALREAMAALTDAGADGCVVTRGAAGAAVLDAGVFHSIEAPAVRAVSAVGSGDAFTAGLAVRLVEGTTVPDACRFATACGAANALQEDAGHVDLADVDRLEREVRVTQG